jgi:hypothetical protein
MGASGSINTELDAKQRIVLEPRITREICEPIYILEHLSDPPVGVVLY